jgi:aspartate-semialdehyde dehydrogenase
MSKTNVGVIGATGAVGQQLVRMLDGHPWFEVAAMSGSERTTGKLYRDTLRPTAGHAPLSDSLLDMRLSPSRPEAFSECQLVFSALPTEAAQQIEPELARAGIGVVSNASAFRADDDVPLIVPEVNPDHLQLIDTQRRQRGWNGFIVTNPNCSAIILTLALAPLHAAFGLRRVSVTTLQAVSGAGFGGVGSLDIIDNVVPYIGGEEDKLETEPVKLLSTLDVSDDLPRLQPPGALTLSAQCTRVPTTHGHLEMVSVELERKPPITELVECWQSWRPLPQELGLPTAPREPVVVLQEPNRPQPRLDRDTGNGMASVIGRLRECPVLDYKFAVLGHNLVRGAAGGVLLIAELLRMQLGDSVDV